MVGRFVEEVGFNWARSERLREL